MAVVDPGSTAGFRGARMQEHLPLTDETVVVYPDICLKTLEVWLVVVDQEVRWSDGIGDVPVDDHRLQLGRTELNDLGVPVLDPGNII